MTNPVGPEDVARCRSCAADVVWIRYVNPAGVPMGLMPLDAAPAPRGDLVFLPVVNGRLRARAATDADAADIPRFRSHFATCPNADEHRRTRDSGKAAAV